VGNPKTSRKESDVAVALARPLHASTVGPSKNGKTKQATLKRELSLAEAPSALVLAL